MQSNEGSQPLRFVSGRSYPFSGQAVAASPFGIRRTFLNETVPQEPLDDAVESPGAELYSLVSHRGDVLHDAVAVARPFHQSEENVEFN